MNLSIVKQQGLAAIELTIILPFILLLIFATAEFGRMLYQYNALNKSVRDAARYVSNWARPIESPVLEINDEIALNAKNLILYGYIVSDEPGTPLLPNLSADDITISDSDPFITIRVNYHWQPIFSDSVSTSDTLSTFGFGNDIDLSFPLVATYTMRAL